MTTTRIWSPVGRRMSGTIERGFRQRSRVDDERRSRSTARKRFLGTNDDAEATRYRRRYEAAASVVAAAARITSTRYSSLYRWWLSFRHTAALLAESPPYIADPQNTLQTYRQRRNIAYKKSGDR